MLPEVKEGLKLDVKHFPTKYQALIFRLWESVSAKKLAEVLKTDEATVKKTAANMGLGEQENTDIWQTRGYISIIRHTWNLLPYKQICQLLDWDEERLGFILKEDDFLDIKLGGWNPRKTDCEEVLYYPLTEEEKKQTEKIKNIMSTYINPLMEKGVEPAFDFFADRYGSICPKQKKEITIDGSWELNVHCDGVEDFIRDFTEEVKSAYNVEFCKKSEKTIDVYMNIQSDDEEYHEIYIKDDNITLNASTPVGVMRALYYLLDLASSAGGLTFDKKTYKRKTKVKTRVIYSFCGLYSDVLDRDLNISFPDKLLKGYARNGINGVWIQGVFYKIAPYPFDEKKCEGWEERIQRLDELTRKCARYGIKVYMYVNEPRNLPVEFFDDNPQLKGTTFVDGRYACLCSSHPDTHKYLKDTIRTICTKAPLLGGFICISQNENNPFCWSGGEDGGNVVELCSVCGKRKSTEVTAEILNTMADEVAAVNEKIKFFAYAWVWDDNFGELQEDLVDRLSKNIIVLQVSEDGIEFERGGVKNEEKDYSLSIIGPGEIATGLWNSAKKNGLEVAAKIQVNNSWEASTVPYLPVYDNLIKHLQNLDSEGIEHLMLSWTLGGYVSENTKIASAYYFEDTENKDDVYESVLRLTYGEYADNVSSAASYFCKGFNEYPFDHFHIYLGPANAGAANLMYGEPTGMESTMTCYPYDDVKGWCGPVYTPEILENQYAKVCAGWEKGLEFIKDMPLCEFKDMAVYSYTLFKASLNQISFYNIRNSNGDKEKMKEIVRNEKQLALTALEIMLRNSAVGYEAANHYYVTRSSLMEKVINCEWLLENL